MPTSENNSSLMDRRRALIESLLDKQGISPIVGEFQNCQGLATIRSPQPMLNSGSGSYNRSIPKAALTTSRWPSALVVILMPIALKNA